MRKNYTFGLLLFIFGLLNGFSSFGQNPYLYINKSASTSEIEGSSTSYYLSISGAITTPIFVNISTTTGTADTSDFTTLTTTITIPAGQTSSQTFSIVTTNDAIAESNEYYTINASTTSENTSNLSQQRTGTIIDNDTVPTVNISANSTVYEGQSSISISFNLSNPFNNNVIINCVTSTGTAGASDFTSINTMKAISAGQYSTSIIIPINNDSLIESDETFTLTATVTSGNTTNTSLVKTITIRDNDTTPTLIISYPSISANEGQTVTVSAYLNRPYNSNVVVQFTSTNGTAGGSDYTFSTINQTILAGNTSVQVSIPTTNDLIDEPVETFTVTGTVTSGNTTNTSVLANVSINDNDGLPDLFINGESSILEGFNYTGYINLSAVSSSNTNIQITTINGTAGNLDYSTVITTITIPAGQNSATFSIPTILDTIQETTENFTINATVLSGNTFDSNISKVVDIIDNYNVKVNADNFESIAGVGATFQILTNDTLHGLTVNFSDVNINLAANSYGITVDYQGVLTVPSTLEIESYQLSYTLCEVANPLNCSTGTILLIIKSPLSVTYFANYSDNNSDGITNAGDVVYFQFTLNNLGNTAITNIIDNLSPDLIFTGLPLGVLNAGSVDSTSVTAYHILTQNDINYGYGGGIFQELSFLGTYNASNIYAWATLQGPELSLNIIPTGLKLTSFIDSNTNGVQDTTEVNFPYGNFDYSIDGGVVHNIYWNSTYYIYESNPLANYNLSYNIDTPYATYNTCTTTYPNTTVPVGSGMTTKNFPIIATPYQDLGVYLVPFSSPRPGTVYENKIVYKNYSNQTVPSGAITFTKNNVVTITNISQTGTTTTSNGFTYNFTNLLPYETRTITVEMLVPAIPTVSLNQILTNSVSINIPIGDIVPSNNSSSLTQIIIGSYDPNDKTESHGGKILHSSFTANDYLTYTIRFENTGTANALFVKVDDILDNKLEPLSIRMIASSHPYVLDRVGANLTWRFNGIDLPPSSPASTTIGHGYIVFQVKPKPGFAIGDVIPNTANIYFDFNPAIVTNTCTTEFVSTLSNENFTFNNFKSFPNPVKNSLTISNASPIEAIEISSILGQRMISKKVNDIQTEIDLSQLSNGIYFVKVSSQGNEKTIKIVKE